MKLKTHNNQGSFLVVVGLLVLLIALLGAFPIAAQDDEGGDETTGDESTVSIFVVICETQAVVNLSGNMASNLDVYFQVFSAPGGTGQALSSLRRANVSGGTYTFSEIVSYTDGATIPAGSTGSVYVSISRVGAPETSAYNEFVDDIQDGCAEPQNPLGASIVDGGNAFPALNTGDGSSAGTTADGTSAILSPFGGVINPNYVPPDKSAVVIGPRETFVPPRQETAGIIFAECDAFPVAEPGIVYDTDNVVVFWSWFATSQELLQQHLDAVNYSVTYYQVLPLPNVVRTEIREINGLFWVFYYSQLGNLLPGEYWIEYKVTWDEAISDGFADYGPGTDTPEIVTGCSFDILPNPDGVEVNHNPWPFQ